MNKYYIYLMIDTSHTIIHAGYCVDILKTIAWYKKFPCCLISGNQLNRLVWIGIVNSKEDAESEFNRLTRLTFDFKFLTIENQNPNFIELVPGQNIDIT